MATREENFISAMSNLYQHNNAGNSLYYSYPNTSPLTPIFSSPRTPASQYSTPSPTHYSPHTPSSHHSGSPSSRMSSGRGDIWSLPDPPRGQKPEYKDHVLIECALLTAENRTLTSKQICEVISSRFEYYRQEDKFE
jgi:hypothetical protein